MELTSKELGSVNDALIAEKLAMEKAGEYAAKVTDPALRTQFEKEKKQHAAHFERLYGLL